MEQRDEMREAFERWASNDNSFPEALRKDASGTYLFAFANAGWQIWQAAWAAARSAS
jgi:hypothetical protein